MRAENRHIKSIREFTHLFPRSPLSKVLVKKGAKLKDTMHLIPGVVRKTLYQTKQLAPVVKGSTDYETAENIYNWACTYVRYRRERGELVQSPQYTLSTQSGDCEDFSILVCSLLLNNNVRGEILFRVAAYDEENGFQHIYPVLVGENGKEIIIDCVVEQFNWEKPYTEKEDFKMDLYYLNGIPEDKGNQNKKSIDAEDLFKDELGKLNIFNNVKQGVNKIKDSKLVNNVKNGIHAINKVNPATVTLRMGLLAAMKINVFNVAGALRFTYLSDAEAVKRKFNMVRFQKLKKVRERLEKVFHNAGGEISNLKTAILTGKGNSNKDVPLSGLGTLDTKRYSEDHSLREILGDKIFQSENPHSEKLSGTLGDPITGAALASATVALEAFAKLIKSIGILKGGDKESPDNGSETTTSNDESLTVDSGTSENTETDTSSNDEKSPSAGGAKQTPEKKETPAGDETESENANDSTSNADQSQSDRTAKDKANEKDLETKGFKAWAKRNKKTLIITGVSVGIAGAAVIGYKVYTGNKKKKEKGLSGVKAKKKSGKNKAKPKKKATSIKFKRLS